MTDAEYIKAVLQTCPHVTVDPMDMHISFLGPEPLQYSIESDPADPVLKRYRGGDTQRRYAFMLLARVDAIDDGQRTENEAHFNDLAAWFEKQTRAHALPPMQDGARLMFLRATGQGYYYETEDSQNAAGFMMQCELIYYQKAR